MVRKCCVCGNSQRGQRYHGIPSDEDAAFRWYAALDIDKENLPSKAVVCGNHFLERDYIPGKRCLKLDSIPATPLSKKPRLESTQISPTIQPAVSTLASLLMSPPGQCKSLSSDKTPLTVRTPVGQLPPPSPLFTRPSPTVTRERLHAPKLRNLLTAIPVTPNSDQFLTAALSQLHQSKCQLKLPTSTPPFFTKPPVRDQPLQSENNQLLATSLKLPTSTPPFFTKPPVRDQPLHSENNQLLATPLKLPTSTPPFFTKPPVRDQPLQSENNQLLATPLKLPTSTPPFFTKPPVRDQPLQSENNQLLATPFKHHPLEYLPLPSTPVNINYQTMRSYDTYQTPITQHHSSSMVEARPRSLQFDSTILKSELQLARQQTKRAKASRDKKSNEIADLKKKLREMEKENITANDFQKQLLIKPGKSGYSGIVKQFAQEVHFFSPSAYEVVRKKFVLPAASTLRRWAGALNVEPGITEFSIYSLTKLAERSDRKILVTLMMDGMSIKENITFNKYADKITGFDEKGKKAHEAMVIMVVGVNMHFKIPVGYKFINGMTAKELADLIKETLHRLDSTGVQVIAMTADGLPANVDCMRQLGAKFDPSDMKPWFLNPANGEEICVFWDACHMAKLIRNYLKKEGLLINQNGKIIRWDHISGLHRVQKENGILAANKLTEQHIKFHNKKMNVKLAVQVLSNSVSKGVELLNELGYKGYEEVSGTADFLATIDKLFDILNTRNLNGKWYKRPLSIANKQRWYSHLEKAEALCRTVTNSGHAKMVETIRKTGFLGMLVNIASTRRIYETFMDCENPKLKFLLTYKFSQDHLELFFASVRQFHGWSNNPDTNQFMSAYKMLLINNHITPVITGNTQQLDNTTILSSDEMEEVDTDHQYAQSISSTTLTSFAANSAAYIAGYVIRSLSKQPNKCDDCLSLLRNSEADPLDAESARLIRLRDNGGLVTPSGSMHKVCVAAEKAIVLMKAKYGDEPPTSGVRQRLVRDTKLSLINKPLFSNIDEHLADQETSINNHFTTLLDKILNSYITIKLHLFTSRITEKSVGVPIRAKLSKLILFKHQ